MEQASVVLQVSRQGGSQEEWSWGIQWEAGTGATPRLVSVFNPSGTGQGG